MTRIRGSVEAAVAPVLIVGLGNRLLRDDGVGVELLSRIEPRAAAWRDQVELLDGGTQGLALLGKLAGREAVVFLDAIRMGAEPGTVHVFRGEELGRMGSRATTAHEGGVTEILGALALLGETPPEVIVIGVEPGEIETGIGLSEPVGAVLEQAVQRAEEVMERCTHVSCSPR